MDTKSLLQQFEPRPGKVVEYERQLWQARYSPCGRFLVAGGYDATLQRWDVSGEEPMLLKPIAGHHGWAQCLAFHPTAGHLFSADSWGKLACTPYAGESPQPVWSLDQAHDGWIRALVVSPDGTRLATVGDDRIVRIWSCETGKLDKELPVHPQRVFSLAFAPDGRSVVSGDLYGTLRQWELATGKVQRTFDAKVLYKVSRMQDCGGARHLLIDPAGKYLLCAGMYEPDGGFAKGAPAVLVFDWQTGKQVQEMKVGGTEDGFAYDAQFHPAGFVMGTSCAFPGKGHVWFWKPGDEAAFYTSNKIPNGRSLSLHPQGRRLALTVSESRNGNGRPKGEYLGGTAKIHLLELPADEG